jgi:hypothetical protein
MFGTPTDHLSSRAVHLLPKPLLNYAMESLLTIHYGDLKQFGLKPKHDFMKAHPTVNEFVLPQIQSGKVKIYPHIKRFDDNLVTFEDDTQIRVDNIIHCTGYNVETPFMDSSILGKYTEKSNRIRLYHNVFPINYKNLAFVGYIQPPHSIFPYAEMQARWVAGVFSGSCPALPPKNEMRDHVDMQWLNHTDKYVSRERHTIQVDAEYLDKIATLIGCQVFVI